VADPVVGYRVQGLVDQPGRVVIMLRVAGAAVLLAGKGDNCEVVIGIG
jgi:hypothetical protein